MSNSIIFITPVWQRFELTEIVLKHRKKMCDELGRNGITATSVIIGDDENLDIARSLGFDVVERDNEFLSAKFNDGYEHAYHSDYDYCYPVGSDSIITADQFLHTLGEELPMSSQFYCMIHYTGMERIDVTITVPGGIGPLIIPTNLLSGCPRPIAENLKKGCDNAARQTILRNGLEILTRQEHQWEHTAFQSGYTQITDFERIRRVYRAPVYDIDNGMFPEIESRYDSDTLLALRDYYESRRSQDA